MTTVERLRARLSEQGHDVSGHEFHRTYAGWAQRASGAWSWFLQAPSAGALDYGSQLPVSDLLRCKHDWDISRSNQHEVSVDPCVVCQRAGR